MPSLTAIRTVLRTRYVRGLNSVTVANSVSVAILVGVASSGGLANSACAHVFLSIFVSLDETQ